jgi:hypothetical protein
MHDAHEHETHGSTKGNHDGNDGDRRGPTYQLDLEGVEYEWHERTITVAQIRELAGWPADQPVVIVNLHTNEETALDEGVPVELKPGHGFGRKFKFRRGIW